MITIYLAQNKVIPVDEINLIWLYAGIETILESIILFAPIYIK